MVTKGKYYNRDNICEECRIEKLKPGNACREYSVDGNWSGRWLCEKCRDRLKERLPNSSHSVIKSMTNIRTNNIDLNSNFGKGFLFEILTCKWRGVRNLNIDNDSFKSPIDHSPDIEFGIIQTKGSKYSSGIWHACFINEYEKDFDNLIFYCTDKYMKNIERIYIFPRYEVIKRTNISIYHRPSDYKTVKLVNNIFQEIIKRIKK